MTREEVAIALRDFFEEASKSQTLEEWDRVFIKYVMRIAKEEE